MSGHLRGPGIGLLAEKGSELSSAPNLLLPDPWRLIFTCQEDAEAVLFGGRISVPVNPSPQRDFMVKSVKSVLLHP